MTNGNANRSQKVVKVAGFMFLFALIVPTLNWALVLSQFNVAENAIATANKIVANEFLFRMGITVELFLSIGLIVLGLALYVILQPANKTLALLALLLKLVEATLMAVTVLVLFVALQPLGTNADISSVPELLRFLIGAIFNSHDAITAIPMVFLGLDMILFSYLFYISNYIPRVLAGFGILSFVLVFIQSLMFVLIPEYAMMPINQVIFWVPSGIFEIVIGLWLLVKGINVPSREHQVIA